MGKKKFIEKKKSATFQLIARDSSEPNPNSLGSSSNSDRVFVRVDNNPYSSHGFLDEEDDSDTDDVDVLLHDRFDESIFADAPGDEDYGQVRNQIQKRLLPDAVRRQILELGLPDDGYNYLLHLREIKNAGGGSAYYHNSKAKLDRVPLDVKAYDASAVRISTVVKHDTNDESLYSVSSKTVGVRVQKAVDPEVAALLDDSDLSRFGSDVDDLEEDFIVQANLLDGGEEELIGDEKKVVVDAQSEVIQREESESADNLVYSDELKSQRHEDDNVGGDEKPRVWRLLDEQFDLLALREYGTDSDNDDTGSIGTEGESLANKLNHALKDYDVNDLDLDDKYRAPGDFVRGNQGSDEGKRQGSSADVLRRCAEYAEMYSHENHDVEDLVVLQESSDESEVWDCETIVSTYSNLDNHPGKIQAPEKPRKKLPVTISGASTDNSHVISLRGKEKLPVEFLPHGRRTVMEKAKKATTMGTDMQKRRPIGEESKEEKKERKTAVKEERREARRAKKELKELYKCEAQRAQKVVAISGPCSIHLM